MKKKIIVTFFTELRSVSVSEMLLSMSKDGRLVRIVRTVMLQ